MITIEHDLLYDPADGGESREGCVLEVLPLFGLERAMGVDDAIPNEGDTVYFRLSDDDGEAHYEGTLTDDDDCENQEAALRWGAADTGCTIIEVRRNTRWVQEIG